MVAVDHVDGESVAERDWMPRRAKSPSQTAGSDFLQQPPRRATEHW